MSGNGNKTIADRNQYVVKANDLIRKTRYNLTTQQQKIVLFAISKIKPSDNPNTQYEIRIDDLCNACGLSTDKSGGFYYAAIKEDLRKLTKREWCIMPDKTEQTISWIGDTKFVPMSGTVTITFNPNMAPFLFDLKEKYTQFKLEKVLVFKGKYAIRLYELVRSYTTQHAIDNGTEKEIRFTLDELRDIMAVSSYPRWADFDRFVIKPAIEEINQYSDEFNISYQIYREGRSAKGVIFTLGSPSAIQQINARKKKRARLNGG